MPRKKLTDQERAFGQAVGAVLAQRRNLRGLSGQDLSNGCGVSVDAIRSIELGRVASPGLYVVARIALALNLSLDEVASPIHATLPNPNPPKTAPTDQEARS